MANLVTFSEAFTLLYNELKKQLDGTGPICLSAPIFLAFKQTTVPVDNEQLKSLVRLFDGSQKKGCFLRLDARSMYLVVSVVLQFRPDHVLEKMLDFVMNNFKIYHQSSKDKVLQKYFSKAQIHCQTEKWRKYTASKLVARLCKIVTDGSTQMETKRLAVELLTSVCGHDAELWHMVVGDDLIKDSNICAVFRTADDYVLRMLLANIFRRMLNLAVPSKRIFGPDTVIPKGLSREWLDQVFIGATVDLMSSLDVSKTFFGVKRSHIFRAYVDSNSTRRLAQLADRVLVIIDSVMTILCVKEDKTSFDRITILLSNRSGCVLNDVDARSATIVVTPDSVQNFFYERGGKFDLTEFTLTFDTLLESHLFRRLLMPDGNIFQTEIPTCKNHDASTSAKTVSYMANGKPPDDQATSDPFVKAGTVLDSIFNESARARSTNLDIALRASQQGKHTSRAVLAVPAAYATVEENSDEVAPSPLGMMRGNEGITLAQRLVEARPDPTLADPMCSANDNDFAIFSTTNASLSRAKRTYRKSKIANNRSAQTAEINTLVDPRPMHDTGLHGPRTTSLEVQQLKQASLMPRAESIDQGMVSTVRKPVNKKQNDQEEKGKCHDIEPSESLRDSAGQNHGRNLGQIEETRTGHTRLKTRTRKRALDPTFNDKKTVWEEPAIRETSEAEAGLATKKSQSSARTTSRKKKVTQKASRFKVSREEVSLPESTASVHVVTTHEPEVPKSGQAPALDQHDKANPKKLTPQQDIADGKGGSLDRNIVTALDRGGFTGSAATQQFDSPDKSFAAKLVNITRPHIVQMKAQLSRPTTSINQARMDAIESDPPGAELIHHGDAIDHAATMSSTEPSNDPSEGGENPTGDARQDVQGAAADTLEDTNFCALKPSNDQGQDIDERCAESLHSGTAEIELRCDQFPEVHADHGDVVMSAKAQPLDRGLCDSNGAKTTSGNIDDTNHRSSMDAEGGSAPDPSMNRRAIPIQPTACTVRDKQLSDGPETARPHNESRNARHNINASSSGRKRTTSRLTGRNAEDRRALRTPIVHFSENGPTNRGTPIQRRVSRGLSAAEVASEDLTKFATTEKEKARPASISESELIEPPAVLDDAQTSNCDQKRGRRFLFREQLVANNIVSPNDADCSKLVSSSPGQEQSYSFDTEQLPGSDQDSGADLVDVTCKDTDVVDSRIVEPAKEDSVVPTERSLHLQQRLEESCSEHSLTTEQQQPVMATTVVEPLENFTTSRVTAAQPNVPSKPEHTTVSRIHGMKRVASVPSDLRAEPRIGLQDISDAAWLSSGIMHNKRKLNTESMPPPLKPAKVARIDTVSQFSARGCENIASVLKHDTTEPGESRSSSIAITRLVNESNICVQTKETSQNEMAKQHTSEFSHVHSHAEIPPMPQTTVKSLGHSKYHDADKTLVGHVRFQDVLSGLIPGVAGNVHSSPVQSPLDSRNFPAETEIGNHPGDDLIHQIAISMQNMFEDILRKLEHEEKTIETYKDNMFKVCRLAVESFQQTCHERLEREANEIRDVLSAKQETLRRGMDVLSTQSSTDIYTFNVAQRRKKVLERFQSINL